MMTQPLSAGSPSQLAGRRIENAALALLLSHGHALVARNHACRLGEVDLITLHEGFLVFTEVRWRRRDGHGGAAASVTAAKQRRIVNAARHFLMLHPERQRQPMRFDVIACHGPVTHLCTTWIPSAFVP